jgi:two-component system cell cycle sensor histidine kinase/response regulator CckA
MSTKLRLLHIEDSESDAALVHRLLEKGGYDVEAERVETIEEFRAALTGGRAWDVIIADYRLPNFDTPATFALLRQMALDVPVIVVSGTIGEEVAVELMKAGASDYVMKDHLARLAPAVEREIAEARSRRARRQTEKTLVESTERLAIALEAAQMGTWEWNLVTNEVYWSPECYRIVKIDKFDGNFEHFAKLVHPDDIQRLADAARRAVAERSVFSLEFRVFRGDGELRWVSNFAQARYGVDGQPLRLMGIVQDIDNRKRSEDALIRSQATLDSLVASALDAVVVIDAAGTVVLWNPAAAKMFGYQAAEVLGRQLHELVVPPRMRAIAQKGFDLFIDSGEGRIVGSVVELAARRKDGSEFPVELGVAALRMPGALQAVGVVRDITARKQAEAALRESENRWQFALEGSGDGVWDWNAETNTTYFSRQWKAMLGYAEDEISDRPSEFDDRLHPEDREKVRLALEKHYSGESPIYSAEHRLRHKDGTYKWILGHGKVIRRSPEGKPLRVIGTHTDLTAVKAAEEEREKLRAQFLQSQKMESIGRLAGGVAHDFNNLLTVINGYAALLLGRIGADHPMRDSLDQIEKAGERATVLVRQLLAFSRKGVPVRETVVLDQLIENLRKSIFPLVGDDIRIVTNLEADLAAIMVDRSQLEQVVVNLVVNGRDAMPHGGVLTIQTSSGWVEGHCAVCNSAIEPASYVTLTVRDTGTGMDEETVHRLFEPFFTTKPVGKGTGLGMSVVHGIVTQNNGHIEVETKLGAGTEFRLHFPAVDMEGQTPKRVLIPALNGSERLLLVEDDAEVRRYLVQALGEYGYRVSAASSAEEALASAASEPVDLLVTDVSMPGTNGRDLAARIRAVRPGVRVLFVSGYESGAGEIDLDDGEAFIQKPFVPHELAAKVREVLDARSASMRVLLVDDEPGVRSFLRSVLEPEGYELKEAADGEQALKMLRTWTADLVITDLVMPEKEGLETIQILRLDYPKVRILAISGAGGGSYLSVAKHLGAHGVLAKPVNPEALRAKVRDLLRA